MKILSVFLYKILGNLTIFWYLPINQLVSDNILESNCRVLNCENSGLCISAPSVEETCVCNNDFTGKSCELQVWSIGGNFGDLNKNVILALLPLLIIGFIAGFVLSKYLKPVSDVENAV